MTAPVKFPVDPAKAWSAACAGHLRLNREARAQALLHAARETAADYRWIGDRNRWLTVRRLAGPVPSLDMLFGDLIAAVAKDSDVTVMAALDAIVGDGS